MNEELIVGVLDAWQIGSCKADKLLLLNIYQVKSYSRNRWEVQI